MGKLIDPERRARAKRQRAEKKRRILSVARSTFAKLPFVEVTLDSIGHRADVDRGVASMYFRTKEELFLLLLREELANWYADLEKMLDRTEGPVAPTDISWIHIIRNPLTDRQESILFDMKQLTLGNEVENPPIEPGDLIWVPWDNQPFYGPGLTTTITSILGQTIGFLRILEEI